MTTNPKPYMREYIADYRKKKKSAAKEAKGGKCSKCGKAINLEFHHTKQAGKKVEPADMWTESKETQKKELAKTKLLCEKCHQKVAPGRPKKKG